MRGHSVIAAIFVLSVAGTYAQQGQAPEPRQGQPATQQQGQGHDTVAKEAQQRAAETTKGATVQGADRTFMTRAASDGQKEVMLAELAQQKGSAESVKALAARIHKDHQQANQELMSLAQSKGVTLSDKPDQKAHAAHMAKFERLEGPAFDRMYSQMMVQDHTNAIALFERATKSKDADVKAFADKTLPALREHLKLSREAQESLKASTAGTAAPAGSGKKP